MISKNLFNKLISKKVTRKDLDALEINKQQRNKIIDVLKDSGGSGETSPVESLVMAHYKFINSNPNDDLVYIKNFCSDDIEYMQPNCVGLFYCDFPCYVNTKYNGWQCINSFDSTTAYLLGHSGYDDFEHEGNMSNVLELIILNDTVKEDIIRDIVTKLDSLVGKTFDNRKHVDENYGGLCYCFSSTLKVEKVK